MGPFSVQLELQALPDDVFGVLKLQEAIGRIGARNDQVLAGIGVGGQNKMRVLQKGLLVNKLNSLDRLRLQIQVALFAVLVRIVKLESVGRAEGLTVDELKCRPFPRAIDQG